MRDCIVLLFWRLAVLASLLPIAVQSQVQRTRMVKLMGARFDITIVARDSISAERNIDSCIAEITRIEYLISDWIDTTQVSRINKNAGIKPVKVDKEVLDLTLRAIAISKLTRGAFDISFAAMEKIWLFDGSMTEMPSRKTVKRAKAKVGYKKIIVDTVQSTIYLAEAGMKIGFGALGEGYAVDRCKVIMLSQGIPAGIVNGSGDMNTWGTRPDGTAWQAGIRDPFQKSKLYAVIPLMSGAIVTSGSYEKYTEINGKRYSHIINPVTGYPAAGLTSVTILGPGAEMANAFSTSLMVMGRKKGLKLLRKFPDYSCIMITDKGKFYWSENIPLERYRVTDK